jgi:phage baseplate assembly protein W
MSGFFFPMSGSSPASSPTATRDERARVLGRDILFDGDFQATPDGDWQTVEGIAAMRQAVYHRLITRPGEYRFRPEYGVGVQDFLKEEMTPSAIADLKTRIRTNILQDRRVSDTVVTVDELTAGPGLQIGVWVTVAAEKLSLGTFIFPRQ